MQYDDRMMKFLRQFYEVHLLDFMFRPIWIFWKRKYRNMNFLKDFLLLERFYSIKARLFSAWQYFHRFLINLSYLCHNPVIE